MDISFSMQATIPNHVLIKELDGESVLLNLENGQYSGLDETGTHMWTALTTSGSIQAAYDVLLPEYDVEPERLRHDLHELVRKLVESDYLEVASH